MLGFLTEILTKYQISVGLEIIMGTDYSVGRNLKKKWQNRRNIGKISVQIRYLIWTKKIEHGQRIAATKDSTKNYQFIDNFLKVFF